MRTLLIPAATLLALGAAYGAGKLMKEGQWEVTTSMEMNGRAMPGQTVQKCVKPEDVKDPEQVLKSTQRSENCELKDVKATGSKLSWSVVCRKGGNTQTGHGEMTFSGESYTGTMTFEMNDPRMGNAKIVSHVSGRRTGDCP